MKHLLPLIFLLAACPPPPVLTPDDPDPSSLTVGGPSELLVGAEAQYTVTAEIEGQVFEPEASWSSTDEGVLLVDSAGFAIAIGPGTATVSASFEGLSDGVEVVVTAPTGPPAELRYDSPVTYVVGASIAANAPRQSGGLVTSWSIFPSLPTGLRMDGTTGVIVGTPLVEVPPTQFTVTAANDEGEDSFALELSAVCTPNVAPPQDADSPDADFVDDNGDGIDGMACGPVFVSPTGSDDNDGLRDSPMRSLNAALVEAASRNPIRDVYVAQGTYLEEIEIDNLTSLVGGFDESWSRAAGQRARIEGGQPVRVSAPVALVDLELRAIDGAPHSIALVVEDAAQVTVSHCTVRAGRGEDGKDGLPGSSPLLAGDFGRSGQAGCEYTGAACGSCTIPSAGRGGFGAFIAADGGRGGAPGEAGQDGIGGEDVGIVALGGLGGRVDGDRRGDNGDPGPDGVTGQDGAGGGSGQDGGDGQSGTVGRGGGGGGGGAGGNNFCNSYGGAGGGGGAGGEPGTAGTGGEGGGASIAILASGSELILESVDLESGRGGDGGIGGQGGKGSLGGSGGLGGSGEDDSGAGGDGGAGGAGGDGGHGGGGGGGASVGILIDDATRLSESSTIFVQGTSGFAGGGPGAPGARGDEGQIREGSLD